MQILPKDIIRFFLDHTTASSFYTLLPRLLFNDLHEYRHLKHAQQRLLVITTKQCDERLKVISRLPNGHWHGFTRHWDTNGKLTHTAYFINDKENGTSLSYDSRNGKLLEFESYKDGIYHGHCISYYGGGKICSRSFYINGKREGLHELYHYPRGIWKREHYINGVQHGLEEGFNRDGTLKYTRLWDNDTIVEETGDPSPPVSESSE